ncbi:unnamed protein product [Heligmosomoides polygyrus]|uniref:7TM_GPCR_Srx domain-containing protein n=1 Tax=Heligmosomoides polygyrus TaxID=6339 RepID=A0A183FZA2_HELPZ|nr:unnamed protein product [Heligmosomoides polygyrus]
MSTYLFFGAFVYIAFNVEFSTLVKDKVAESSVKTLIFCLALRCLGVMFIALHRYVVVCRWSSKINMVGRLSFGATAAKDMLFYELQTLATSNPLYIIGTHWVLAAIVSSPVSIFTTMVFGPSFEKSVIASDSSFQTADGQITGSVTTVDGRRDGIGVGTSVDRGRFWRRRMTVLPVQLEAAALDRGSQASHR